ncbi:MAG: ATP-binding protein [Nitrososphaeraceae archaeon]
MNQTEDYNQHVRNSKIIHSIFTDFDGRFKGRLGAVIPAKISNLSENAPISAKYDCRIKAEYQKDIMRLLEEGMIVAVRNFKSKITDITSTKESSKNPIDQKFTLLVVSRVWPEHYGLRGLSDATYYPMQFEVIEQSVIDWHGDDMSTMMIQMSTIPINYDLIVHDDGKYEFSRGFSFPIIGDKAYLLNSETIRDMYNKRILEQLQTKTEKNQNTKNPIINVDQQNIGSIKMFENSEEKIPIFVNYDNMIRYHFGIFSFTGGGKSNLLSNILRKILLGSIDHKVVVFDISAEYPFLLMDLFNNNEIKSRIIFESPIKNSEQFYISVVKPRDYEEDERVKRYFSKIYDRGIVSYFIKPQDVTPTFHTILDQLNKLREDSINRPHYINAISEIQRNIREYINQNNLVEKDSINKIFVDDLIRHSAYAMEKFKVNEKSALFGWTSSLDYLINSIQKDDSIKSDNGLTTDQILNIIDGDTRLTCLSISDPYKIKELVISISNEILRKRKRQFKVRPYILFVYDEAQEFVADLSNSKGIDKECSQEVENLLRQGRKYGLGGCIATQRIAYLNTSALQQLHTYFVGTLPRPYDRSVVSSTFTIDQGILEKTLEFAPGEWLLSSYIATGVENIPIFIKADNSEKILEKSLDIC